MLRTDIFWTDIGQAQERLQQSIIVYDGQPVYVERIEEGSGDSTTPRALIRECGICKNEIKSSRKILSSAKFERFRTLPNLGWMNYLGKPSCGALYVSRRPVAGSRLHGLTSTNTTVQNFVQIRDSVTLDMGSYNIFNIMYDKGFVQMHNGEYPSLKQILNNIKDNSSIAYNRQFCVQRDDVGLRWLYFTDSKVGLFTGTDTLTLFSKYNYLREMIMEDKTFTLNNIVEF